MALAGEDDKFVLAVRECVGRFTRTGQCVLKALTLAVTDHHARFKPKTAAVSERDSAVIFILSVRCFPRKIALYF